MIGSSWGGGGGGGVGVGWGVGWIRPTLEPRGSRDIRQFAGMEFVSFMVLQLQVPPCEHLHDCCWGGGGGGTCCK